MVPLMRYFMHTAPVYWLLDKTVHPKKSGDFSFQNQLASRTRLKSFLPNLCGIFTCDLEFASRSLRPPKARLARVWAYVKKSKRPKRRLADRGGGRVMYYPAGFVSMGAFGAAVALPHNGVLWVLARLVLDAAGALFGLYLLAALVHLTAGQVMRLRRPVTSNTVRARW